MLLAQVRVRWLREEKRSGGSFSGRGRRRFYLRRAVPTPDGRFDARLQTVALVDHDLFHDLDIFKAKSRQFRVFDRKQLGNSS